MKEKCGGGRHSESRAPDAAPVLLTPTRPREVNFAASPSVPPGRSLKPRRLVADPRRDGRVMRRRIRKQAYMVLGQGSPVTILHAAARPEYVEEIIDELCYECAAKTRTKATGCFVTSASRTASASGGQLTG